MYNKAKRIKRLGLGLFNSSAQSKVINDGRGWRSIMNGHWKKISPSGILTQVLCMKFLAKACLNSPRIQLIAEYCCGSLKTLFFGVLLRGFRMRDFHQLCLQSRACFEERHALPPPPLPHGVTSLAALHIPSDDEPAHRNLKRTSGKSSRKTDKVKGN